MNQDQTDTHNPVSSQVEGIKNLVASDIAETAESKGPNESSQVEVVNVPNLTAAPNQVRVEQARTLLQNIEPGDHAQSTDQPSSGQPASSTASAPEPPTTTQAGDQPQASMTNGNANTEQTSNEQHEPGTTRATSRSEQVKTEIEHVPNSDRIKKVTMSSVTEREEVRKTTSHSILDNNADMLPNDISLRMHVSKADTLPRMSSGTTSSPGARVIDVRRKVSDTNTTENEGNTDSHTRHTPIRIPVKTILSPSPGPRNIRVMRNPDTVPYQIHEDMRKSYDEEISFLRGMLNRSASGYLPMDDHPKHMYNGRMGHSMFMNDYKDHDGKPDFWYNRALHTEEENRLLSSKIKDVRSAFRKNEHRMTKLQKERDDLYRRLHELEIREQNLVNHIEKVEDEHRNLARDYDVLRKWHNKRERHLQTVLNERTELIRINNILENELNAHYPRRDTLKKYSGDRKYKRRTASNSAYNDDTYKSPTRKQDIALYGSLPPDLQPEIFSPTGDVDYSYRSPFLNALPPRARSVTDQIYRGDPDIGWKSDVSRTEEFSAHKITTWDSQKSKLESDDPKSTNPATAPSAPISTQATLSGSESTRDKTEAKSSKTDKMESSDITEDGDDHTLQSPMSSPQAIKVDLVAGKAENTMTMPDWTEQSMLSPDEEMRTHRSQVQVLVGGNHPSGSSPGGVSERKYRNLKNHNSLRRRRLREGNSANATMTMPHKLDTMHFKLYPVRPASVSACLNEVHQNGRMDYNLHHHHHHHPHHHHSNYLRPETSLSHVPRMDYASMWDKSYGRFGRSYPLKSTPFHRRPARGPSATLPSLYSPTAFRTGESKECAINGGDVSLHPSRTSLEYRLNHINREVEQLRAWVHGL